MIRLLLERRCIIMVDAMLKQEKERIQQILAYYARSPRQEVVKTLMQQAGDGMLEPLYVNVQALAERPYKSEETQEPLQEEKDEEGSPYRIRYQDNALQLFFRNRNAGDSVKIQALVSYTHKGNICCDFQETVLKHGEGVIAFSMPSDSSDCRIYIREES